MIWLDCWEANCKQYIDFRAVQHRPECRVPTEGLRKELRTALNYTFCRLRKRTLGPPLDVA